MRSAPHEKSGPPDRETSGCPPAAAGKVPVPTEAGCVCGSMEVAKNPDEQQELLFPENVLIPDQEPPQLSLWSPGIPHSTQLAQAQVSLQICP